MRKQAAIQINSLLKARQRIQRKITLDSSWSWFTSFKNKVKLCLLVKSLLPFFTDDPGRYALLNRRIYRFAVKKNLLIQYPGVVIHPVSILQKQPWWFDQLRIFDQELRVHNSFLIIQGSYADGETTFYSDVDLVLFYNNLNSNILAIKRRIERFLTKIDPLQHHGVFAIDMQGFDYYWQMDLPVEVLAKAKCFAPKELFLPIKGIINENLSSKQALQATLDEMERFLSGDFQKTGVWRWKFLLSILMLCPTLLLGSMGQYVYKKESFGLVKKWYSEEAWHAINRASDIRQHWPPPKVFSSYSSVRDSVASPLNHQQEAILATEIEAISVQNDPAFYKALSLFVQETRAILTRKCD